MDLKTEKQNRKKERKETMRWKQKGNNGRKRESKK